MERVIRLTTFEEEERENAALLYWLSRPPDERIAEIERLRRDYAENLRGGRLDGASEQVCRTLLLVDREEC